MKMVDQALLSHQALALTADERRALGLALDDLDAGRVPGFNMSEWPTCIGGIAERLGNLRHQSLLGRAKANARCHDHALRKLFSGKGNSQQAARALRSYLRTGEDGWQDAQEGT